MKKIAFLALHLGVGGVEKAIATQSSFLCERYDVEIISVYRLGDEPAFRIDPRVKITYLTENVRPNRAEFLDAVRSFRLVSGTREGIRSVKILAMRRRLMLRAIRSCDADVIISTRELFNGWLSANRPAGAVCLAQEHCHHNGNRRYVSQLLRSLRGIDYLLPVSRELTDFYSGKLAGSRTRCEYLSLSLDSIPSEVSPLTSKQLISVGRLSPEKGYTDLITVFSLILRELPDWHLSLIGDGDDRPRIEAHVRELGLGDSVTLHGFRDQSFIGGQMLGSSVFLMTSFEESFGLVLIEAQSYGVPCVAFSSARGPLEIIEDGKNGFLIPNRDMQKMADTVVALARNPELLASLGAASREGAERFSLENVKKQWFAFFEKII